ncbi:MAG: TIGR00270 family protein [Thermoplasmata archaeon]|nr:MAG: TIGR00270 family protein [Thermoplasmata archaeon]
MQCELCGKKVDTVKYVIVDGARMMVCENCAKLGVPAPPPAEKRLQEVSWKRRISKTDEKIFQSMDRVLVPDWAEKIKEGRIKKGWTREELSAKVGEPVNAIAKMENGDLRPSDETAKKLEKLLGITLFQEVKEIEVTPSSSSERRGLTIGDLIKLEKEKGTK